MSHWTSLEIPKPYRLTLRNTGRISHSPKLMRLILCLRDNASSNPMILKHKPKGFDFIFEAKQNFHTESSSESSTETFSKPFSWYRVTSSINRLTHTRSKQLFSYQNFSCGAFGKIENCRIIDSTEKNIKPLTIEWKLNSHESSFFPVHPMQDFVFQ